MIGDRVQIPPIATGLNDPNQDGRTAQEWYLYWQRSGTEINTLNQMIAHGTAADRPDPADTPDGALYVESDYSGVIYQMQDGEWHYLAGTMWGSISPDDERPTGLGPNDAGFTFRTTNTDPSNSGRTYVWSGSAWIETTVTRYETHATRIAADPTLELNGAIWVETDRSEVLYQLQAGAWHYLAGTMWGTLAPDQRPGDLGANDAGFTFRSTDTTAQSAGRTYVWSGTVWVETTAARFDLHANRLAAVVTKTMNGELWIETDRSEVLYQLQGSAWHFIAGTMWGTLSPDQRPTDLGANDAGFSFRGTDQQRQFIWSGTVWVETVTSQWLNVTGGIAYNAGKVGIGGTTAPVSTLDVIVPSLSPGGTYGMRLALGSGATGVDLLGFGILSGSYSWIQATDPGVAFRHLILQPSGGAVGIGLASAPTHQLQLGLDDAAKPSTNTWTIASDTRTKQNIRPLAGGLEVINRLEPIEGEYNGKAGTPAGGRVVSLDPVKLRAVLPHSVSSIRGRLEPGDTEETDILGVNTHEILYHLVLAVQQLAKKP